MGEFGDIGVGDLLYLFGLRRATGELRVVADGDEVTLRLAAGKLVGVTSDRLPLQLGRVLEQRGLLRREQLDAAKRRQAAERDGKLLGEILVERGWVSPEHLARAIEEQAIGALARVLAAARGTFAYYAQPNAKFSTGTAPLDAQHIVLEAMRRADELSRLRRWFPDRHGLLTPRAGSHVTNRVQTAAEQQVIAALKAGARSIAQLEELVPLDESSLLRTLLTLRRYGLLDDDGQASPEVSAGKPPDERDLASLLASDSSGAADDSSLTSNGRAAETPPAHRPAPPLPIQEESVWPTDSALADGEVAMVLAATPAA
jgi:hypothetical protein